MAAYRFYLDAAFARYFWRVNDELFSCPTETHPLNSPITSLCVLADSSPQGGRNWLLSEIRMLKVSSVHVLLKLINAVGSLTTGAFTDDTVFTDNSLDGNDEDVNSPSDDDVNSPSASWTALSLFILGCFDHHVPPPAALGSKAEGFVQKMAAWLHSMFLEFPTKETLKRALDNVVCFTTDLGTEVLFADSVQKSFEQWFPVQHSRVQSTLQQDCGMQEDMNDVAHEETGFTCKKSLAWPGLMHILHGVTAEMLEKACVHWTWFLTILRAVCQLLTRRWSRERFIEVVATFSEW